MWGTFFGEKLRQTGFSPNEGAENGILPSKRVPVSVLLSFLTARELLAAIAKLLLKLFAHSCELCQIET
jgi:hypothetical protein